MKLTQSQLLSLLSGIGVADVEVVDDEAQSDFDNDALLSTIDANRRGILEPQIKSELEATVANAREGKLNGSWKSALHRATGIPRMDLEKIDKIDDAVKLAVQHKLALLEGDAQATSAKVDELIQTHQQALEAQKSEYEKQLTAANDKYIYRDKLDYVRSLLKEAPLPEGLDRDIAAKDYMKYLEDSYHVSYDEANRKAVLMDKNNPSLPALNEAKNAHIDFMAEAKNYFEPRSLWMKDMRGKNPADAMGGKGDLPKLPNTQPSVTGTASNTVAAQREARMANYQQ